MATQVILPALGMAQETGTIVRWLKAEGEEIAKGEPLAEIETDKATVEIEAPASGVLANVTGTVGVAIPVGQVIASILAPGETPTAGPHEVGPDLSRLGEDRKTVGNEASPLLLRSQPTERNVPPMYRPDVRPDLNAPTQGVGQPSPSSQIASTHAQASTDGRAVGAGEERSGVGTLASPSIQASPLAARIAAEHNLDLNSIQPTGRRIQKADVLAHIQGQPSPTLTIAQPHLLPASPKARRLAAEQGKDLAAITGTGPGGAVLVADVLAVGAGAGPQSLAAPAPTGAPATPVGELSLSSTWRIMAERTTQSWTGTPHFYLLREVNASRLIAWREQILKRSMEAEHVTYTDLLVKIVAAALKMYPPVNASWHAGKVTLHEHVHVGLAVAIEEGLVVPVIHEADKLGLSAIARQRKELVTKAQTGKLRPQDISGGTFTISNLGMYNVDAFNAIINAPQAAILAVGRIAERVVPVLGQPAVQPVMILTLSCDHRVVDGARGAQFLATVATLIEEPLGLLD